MAYRCIGLALAVLGLDSAALAEPFPVTDRSPVARIFAAPAATHAAISRRDGLTFELALDWSTYANVATEPGELLVLDGESVALTGRWRYVRNGWRFGLDMPLIYQSGGVLDGLIDGYHDLFGFPEGSRPSLGKDQLIYAYERDGVRLLDVRGHSAGIGEASVHLARQWRQTHTTDLSWRVHIKLPTGDSDRLLGSGTPGAGASVHAQTTRTWREREWRWFGGVGAQWHDGSDVLGDLHKRTVWSGYGGAQWAMTPGVILRAQLDLRSAYFDSDVRGLGEAATLTVGGDLRLASTWVLRIGVLEDILPRSAPDVVFQVSLLRSE